MRFSPDLQEAILQELAHSPSGTFLIASSIHEAPFRVAAELRVLVAEGTVREVRTHDGILPPIYHLTAAGVGRLGGIPRPTKRALA